LSFSLDEVGVQNLSDAVACKKMLHSVTG